MLILQVAVDKTLHNYGTVATGSSNTAVFTLTNTGSYPLVIYSVSASCGCTNVEWEKHPVSSGQTTTISVEMVPDETSFFSKTIDVYCNIKDSPVRLIVSGNAD